MRTIRKHERLNCMTIFSWHNAWRHALSSTGGQWDEVTEGKQLSRKKISAISLPCGNISSCALSVSKRERSHIDFQMPCSRDVVEILHHESGCTTTVRNGVTKFYFSLKRLINLLADIMCPVECESTLFRVSCNTGEMSLKLCWNTIVNVGFCRV